MSLTQDDINDVTKICFRQNNLPEKADLIYVFGSLSSVDNMLDSVYSLIDNGVCNKVMISGGINPRRTMHRIIGDFSTAHSSEAKIISSLFNSAKYPNTELILEEDSSNTKDNVEFSLHELKQAGKIFFICKDYHAGRAYLTLRKYLPDKGLLQSSYNGASKWSGDAISPDNWYKEESRINTVLGEFNKIYQYGKIKGDIAFSEKEDLIFSRRRHLIQP